MRQVWIMLVVGALASPALAQPDDRAAAAAECQLVGPGVVAIFGSDFAGDRAPYTRGTAEQLGKLLCEVGRWPREARACFRDATAQSASLACLDRIPVPQRLELESGLAAINPSGVELTDTAIRLKGPVLFDDTDRIKPASDALLTAVATFLGAHPAVRIEAQAYVDDAEKPDRALRRSQRRAEAVRTFLIKHQVVEGRVTARGLGSARPIADATTELGRARNRRIELAIVR